MKRILVVFALAAIVLILACGQGQQCKPLSQSQIQALLEKVKSMPLEPVGENEVAVLETNYGTLVIKFFPDKAPEHCKAFKRLVKAGYYDCTQFHRIIKGFVIQGGDILSRDDNPNNDGVGGPGYTLPAEFNDIPHDRGILSMARKGNDINSAGSQFFICLSREGTKALDGQYTVFGKVIEGLDVLDKIANVKTERLPGRGEASHPVEPVYIIKAHMETR